MAGVLHRLVVTGGAVDAGPVVLAGHDVPAEGVAVARLALADVAAAWPLQLGFRGALRMVGNAVVAHLEVRVGAVVALHAGLAHAELVCAAARQLLARRAQRLVVAVAHVVLLVVLGVVGAGLAGEVRDQGARAVRAALAGGAVGPGHAGHLAARGLVPRLGAVHAVAEPGVLLHPPGRAGAARLGAPRGCRVSAARALLAAALGLLALIAARRAVGAVRRGEDLGVGADFAVGALRCPRGRCVLARGALRARRLGRLVVVPARGAVDALGGVERPLRVRADGAFAAVGRARLGRVLSGRALSAGCLADPRLPARRVVHALVPLDLVLVLAGVAVRAAALAVQRLLLARRALEVVLARADRLSILLHRQLRRRVLAHGARDAARVARARLVLPLRAVRADGGPRIGLELPNLAEDAVFRA